MRPRSRNRSASAAMPNLGRPYSSPCPIMFLPRCLASEPPPRQAPIVAARPARGTFCDIPAPARYTSGHFAARPANGCDKPRVEAGHRNSRKRTNPMKTTLLALTAAALASAVAAAPAQAAPQVPVSYADLDIHSAAGAAKLATRVQAAVTQVCI